MDRAHALTNVAMIVNKPHYVLTALDIICNSSDENLRVHQPKVVEASEKLQSYIGRHRLSVAATRVQNAASFDGAPSICPRNDSPQDASLVGTGPAISLVQTDKTSSQPALGVDPGPPILPKRSAKVEQLVQEVKDDFDKVEGFVSRTDPQESDFLPLHDEGTDARVADLMLINKSAKKDMDRFRRGLIQRSLAMEYKAWHVKNKGWCEIDHRARDLTVPLQDGISAFCREEVTDFEGFDKGILQTALRHGVKLLVWEQVSGGIGYTLILMLWYTQCRETTYPALRELCRAFQEEEEISQFARRNEDWLREWQQKYDGKLP